MEELPSANPTPHRPREKAIEQCKEKGGEDCGMKELAKEAAVLLEEIDRTDFFDIYKDLVTERQEKIKRSGFVLLYLEKESFQKALTTYFRKSSSVMVKFTEQGRKIGGGAQLSFLVDVEGPNDQGKSSYYAKTMGNIETRWDWPIEKPLVDLREIFVYKLLSLIELRSNSVHIIPDVPKSGYVYLATKIIEDFFTDEGWTEARLRTKENEIPPKPVDVPKEAGKKVLDEADEQLEILGWLLHLTDLGKGKRGNHGFAPRVDSDPKTYELKIVDFRVMSKTEPTLFDKSKVLPLWKNYAEKWMLKDSFEEVLEKMKKDPAIKPRVAEDQKAYDNKEKDEASLNIFKYVDWLKEKVDEIVEEQQSGGSAAKKPRTH